MKQTNIKWCDAGKPKGNHPLVEHRKRCKQQFRQHMKKLILHYQL